MNTKICFKCKMEVPLNQFYKHKGMIDGHLNKCINCTKKDVRSRELILIKNPQWIEKERDRGREKYYRLNYRDKNRPSTEQKRKWINNHNRKYPEKCLAAKYTEIYLDKEKGYHLHHWSYNQKDWLDIIKLNQKDHYKIHRFIVYDQKTMIYKTLDGKLLNTKEKHIEYINQYI